MTTKYKPIQAPRKGAGAEINNWLGRTGKDRDYLFTAEGNRALAGDTIRMAWDGSGLRMTGGQTARFVSKVIRCKYPAFEFLPSWNIILPKPNQVFHVYMRFYNQDAAAPSPWFFVGESGEKCHKPLSGNTARWGRTHIDYVELFAPASAFQVRIDFKLPRKVADYSSEAPLLKRYFVHYSGQRRSARGTRAVSPPRQKHGKKHILVPYRSQLDVEREELRNSVCCPTSLAMVLEYYRINRPTLEICDAIYNERYDMYGIWPQVSQVASQHGLRSWVTRFRRHEDVRQYLQQGSPIIASIRVGEGELRNARYPKSNGHIIVIVGHDANGDYIVNDPYSAGPGGAEIRYFADDIEKVWLDKGGVAVLVEKEHQRRIAEK